uniref:Uncharacterized protein n=1 Tax=Globisporangium ultimum (strain ATCC 200006 / CBS 805.95 / DAOM BR144) TaxID=431595 RepID=K3WNT4_GLOUD
MGKAATAASKRRGLYPSKSNSERGRAFRERQRQHEVDLLKAVTSFQSEIHSLLVARSLRSQRAQRTRHASTASLVKLVREYHALFRIGIPDPSVGAKRLGGVSEYHDLITRQRLFLESAFDPDFGRFGGKWDVESVVKWWKRYTRYHNGLCMYVDEVEMCGSDASPIVIALGRLRVQYTRNTLEYVFPHVSHDTPLVQRFVGKEVVYTFRNVYAFSGGGRIIAYEPTIDFVQPLLDAGSSIGDLSRLMQQARIGEHYMLGPGDDDDIDEADIFLLAEEILEEKDGDSNEIFSGSHPLPLADGVPRIRSKHEMDFILLHSE